MVRMLVADDASPSSPARNSACVVWLGRLAMPTTQPSRDSVPYCRVGTTRSGRSKRAGHDLDPGAADPAEAQGRAAGGAEIALGDRGGLERRRLAAGPGEIFVLDVGERGERRARCLLAHPAMADADLGRRASTSQSGSAPHWQPPVRTGLVVVLRHACSIRCQASRSIASASPPAKMKSPTPASRSAASCSPGRPAR